MNGPETLVPICPHCGNLDKVHKQGKNRAGKELWWCNGCEKSFLLGKVARVIEVDIKGMRAEEFVGRFCIGGPFLRDQIVERAHSAGVNLSKCERLLKVAVALKLLFKWRHAGTYLYDTILPQVPEKEADVSVPVPTPEEFRSSLKIVMAGQEGLFVPQPWQVEDFRALDAAWSDLVHGTITDGIKRRAWIERPRGHSKTADLAISCAYALAFAEKPIRGIACASDQKQAGHLKDAIERIRRINPELEKRLNVQKVTVASRNGSRMDIMSSDVGSSWGELVDFVIADEVCHWKENAESLWDSLATTAGKQKNCILVAITNAGFMESWQWQRREALRALDWWYFKSLEPDEDFQHSWLKDEYERQREELKNVTFVFDRLWRNIWSVGSGDALTVGDIQACTRLDGPSDPDQGWMYYGGIDLSVSRDATAIVIVGKKHGRVKLCRVVAWKPRSGTKINYDLVWDTVMELNTAFRPQWYIDPYQAEWLSQQLQRLGIFAETITFSGKNTMEMASGLIEVFSARHIELYPEHDLIADLKRLRIKEMPSGYCLSAPRTGQGHCDRATALALAVLGARRAGAFFWPEMMKPANVVKEPQDRTGLSHRQQRGGMFRVSGMNRKRRW